ncbi:pentapeptide repeat-containing protein [Alteromonas gilva]|uniref:Pentapeptide repeat-containing protein n=1 Tax=Alteromonas gilva TaxID=2987522 RepID=A0ABT5KY67_9ALTE|nr:pentapeptide repeat-containing protein [Alteromonas gilva]MDC8829720.1 pentapeptide repeat-containing protein [Alteromonas gilva]
MSIELQQSEWTDNPVKHLGDIEFNVSGVNGVRLSKAHMLRVSAVEKTFERVDFRYSVFDDCYFRKCKFVNCDFTGAQLKNSSFRGSEFIGCKFDYCRFNNTRITNTILDNNQPGFENVALEFAQALRVNFGQIGDVVGVNKAIKHELMATKTHLKKGAFSSEGWYRDKYKSWDRAKFVWNYLTFSSLDFIWGNGESLVKVFRTICLVIFAATLLSILSGEILASSLQASVLVFLGLDSDALPLMLGVPLVLCRFVLLGMFLSVLVKRLSRR